MAIHLSLFTRTRAHSGLDLVAGPVAMASLKAQNNESELEFGARRPTAECDGVRIMGSGIRAEGRLMPAVLKYAWQGARPNPDHSVNGKIDVSYSAERIEIIENPP